MRLKLLTLKGFKSFPKTTKLHFPNGICAIVGPNGCGKSNIMDAIRWVLGEQSPKLLRAKSMTDLIFSGPNGSSPNAAEVRLVLKNNGKFFPPELSNEPEIEILRRVTQNGEGEYRLNGKLCRLKDIHYLFMDTGAGTRAYSIIDQGQVGTFVEMDAKERRRLIEEAAGISRYKSRKIEAMNKIAKTQENLDRTEDILSELKSQLRKLSRQANQAKRFLKLREEEDLLKGTIFSWSWQQALIQKKELKTTLEEIKGNLSTLQVTIEKIDKELENIQATIASSENERLQHKKSIQQRQEILDNLLIQKGDLEAKLQRHSSRLDSALKILNESLKGQEALHRAKERLKAEIQTLEEKVSQSIQKEKILKQGVEEAQAAREKVKTELEQVKSELVDLAAKLARTSSELHSSEDRLFELDARIKRKQTQLKEIEEKLSHNNLELQKISEKLTTLTDKAKSLQDQKSSLTENKEGLESQIQQLDKEIHAQELKLASVSARLKSLKEIENQHSVLLQKKGLKNINSIGIVADFISVSEGYEHIVEAVLGDLLKAPVLDGQTFQEELVKCIDSNISGSFIIPNTSANQKETSLQQANLLSKKVSARPELANFIHNKLSKWEVVENLDEAIQQINDPSNGRGAITKSGEMVSPSGEVKLPGTKVKDPTQSLLVRRSELKKLEKEKETIIQVVHKLKNQLKELQASLKEKNQLLQKVSNELFQITNQKNSLEGQLRKIQLELKGLKERESLIQFELDEAESEKITLMETIEELKKQVALEEKSKQEIQSKLSGREEALKVQEGVLTRRIEALKEHQLEKVRLESDLANKKRELSAIIKRIKGAAFRKEKLETEIGELKQLVNNLNEEIQQLNKKVEIQRNLVKEAQQLLDNQEKQIASLREKNETLLQERREIEKKKGLLEQQLNNATIKYEKICQEMTFLQNAAQEQLQINLSQQYKELLNNDIPFDEAEKKLAEVKAKLSKIGAVNLTAVDEYEEVESRYKFIEEQRDDLIESIQSLQNAIKKIDNTCKERFSTALNNINIKLQEVFPMLFEGGGGELSLSDKNNPLESGVEYLVKLPGKRIKNLALLSGGEKAMAALALIFAIYLTKPSPFCFLDEVDAPLDEANTIRFNKLIKQIANYSQVILITHNQRVMEAADTLYGITMEEKGVSKLVSVNLVEH